MQSLGLATQRVLFEFLISLLQYRKLAWDCETGNGQAALFLSEYFEQVMQARNKLKTHSQGTTYAMKYFLRKRPILKMIA
jgi:hypothetical protein